MVHQLLSTSGRISRLRYFVSSVLFLGGMSSALFGTLTSIAYDPGFTHPTIYITLGLLVWIGVLQYIGFCLAVKRFHDLGRSGWSILFLMIPLVNIYWGCILLFGPGVSGSNKYGEDPKLTAEEKGTLYKEFRIVSIVVAVLVLLLPAVIGVVHAKKASDGAFVISLKMHMVEKQEEKYDSERFLAHLNLIKVLDKPYLIRKDLESVPVPLPAITQILFSLGDTITISKEQKDFFRNSSLQKLRNMSGEDFGSDRKKWGEWYRQKEAGE